LTADECLAVLGRTRLARLACSHHDQPYIVPVFVELDGDYLYSFATVGQKIEWMRANPKVCIQVDDVADAGHWTSVIAFGLYEELTDAPVHREGRARARELLESRREFWFPAAARTSSGEHAFPVVFRITIERLTGRRAARPVPAD
jgi:nitroimidazol reductase NimA-like FMN-containing flavoprotein (pyridoxamine 5'-phosphate oxidase superfamily)